MLIKQFVFMTLEVNDCGRKTCRCTLLISYLNPVHTITTQVYLSKTKLTDPIIFPHKFNLQIGSSLFHS
jgi:hypothetical protein